MLSGFSPHDSSSTRTCWLRFLLNYSFALSQLPANATLSSAYGRRLQVGHGSCWLWNFRGGEKHRKCLIYTVYNALSALLSYSSSYVSRITLFLFFCFTAAAISQLLKKKLATIYTFFPPQNSLNAVFQPLKYGDFLHFSVFTSC